MITFCWFLTMASLVLVLYIGSMFARRLEVLSQRIESFAPVGTTGNPFDLD